MSTTTKTVDWESIVRHHDPDYDNIGPGNKAGFAPYVFGGRIKKWVENDFPKARDLAGLPPCGKWDDSKKWNDKLKWCDHFGVDGKGHGGYEFDLVSENWPGTLEGCYVGENGVLLPASICGGPVNDLCPHLVPEFVYTSIVFDAGAIRTGSIQNEIVSDGDYHQEIRWHTVESNLDSFGWKVMLPGQIITARYLQYRLTVNTQ